MSGQKGHVLLAPPDFNDWAAVHALLLRCFAPMEERIDPPSSLHRMSADVIAAIARENTFAVGLSGEVVIAFGLAEAREQSLYLSKLAVAPEWRGRGLLRRMVRAFEDEARRRGLAGMTLQTRVELSGNHHVFSALGFIKTEETRHPGFDRVTSFTFSRPL